MDTRGLDLVDQIDTSDFGVLNENSPTRVTNDCTSSPDITLASSELLACIDWRTKPSLNSDHVPIIVSLQRFIQIDKSKAKHKSYLNFAKADWQGFCEHVESKISKLPPPRTVHTGEKTLRGILNKAAHRYIPNGKHAEIRPNFPTDAAKLADERDSLKARDPHNPRIRTLCKEITKRVTDHIRTKWRNHLSRSSFKPETRNLWHTIKGLTNPRDRTDNTVISFNDKPIPNTKKCATEFNRQFTPHPSSYDKSVRNTIRHIHQLKQTEPTRFNPEDVQVVIKSTNNSKALGPDNLSPIMLKHVGPLCINYLTSIFNLCMETLDFPRIWKVSKVIPLLKPGKPADKGKSYRPISLLSPLIKILEALILSILKDHIELADHQHGFRKNRSTTTALHHVTEHIQRGLNERRPNKRTILVALDLSRAFDTVCHSTLFRDILDSNIPNNIKRWLVSYLRGRQTVVEYKEVKSQYRKVKQGVPQGGVISPILFNFYVSKMPLPPEGIQLTTYADDCTILCSDNKIGNICEQINPYLDTLKNWFRERKLELSAEKSTATLFTTWTKEVNTELDIKIEGNKIPTTKHPKILGLTFDNLLMFNEHVNITRSKAQKRNNVLKALAGSTWGKEKEIITITYKAITRSIINYAAPIWSPQVSETNWKKLQVIQNAALRIATGCHLMSHQDHLHRETQIIPVQQHNILLSLQYLATCLLPSHTCNNIVTAPQPPRSIRRSLVNTYLPILRERHLMGDSVTNENIKHIAKNIHTNIVNDAIEGYMSNRVLGTNVVPDIDSAEVSLPRSTRATLAQLRSGWCKLLQHYMARIDPSVPDRCPRCSGSPHDVHPLFNCPDLPTILDPTALWTNPVEVAQLLGLETEM
ncbi:hypothetical protein M8J77_010316 [Diaphorina citri]|nr:hypothetical protein M8J77_010316 [Diaphorina citri]